MLVQHFKTHLIDKQPMFENHKEMKRLLSFTNTNLQTFKRKLASPNDSSYANMYIIEGFHSRDYRPYWFTETKESICIKIEFNSRSQRFKAGFHMIADRRSQIAIRSAIVYDPAIVIADDRRR